MPKQIYQLRDFSGGLNNLKDATDIGDNEVAEAKNMSFTEQGAVGGAFNMKNGVGAGSGNNLVTAYNTGTGDHIDHLEAGYGLGYFETDHRADAANSRSLAIAGDGAVTRSGFLIATSGDRIYMYAMNDGNVKNSPSDGSNGADGSAVNLHTWFPTGTQIVISGSTQGANTGSGATTFSAGVVDGIHTVVGGNGTTEINLDRTPAALIPTAAGGGNVTDPCVYFTATVTSVESGDQVLLLAHPNEHKIDVYSTSKSGWTTDVITLQGHTSDNTKSKVLYYKSGESIRCCDTNRDVGSSIQWYGWISRQHFSYPGNTNANEYSGFYAKDNNLAPPSFGEYEKDAVTLTYPTAGKGFNLKCLTTTDDGLVEGKTYEFAQSFIYDGNQESLLSHYNKLDNSPISTLDTTLSATDLKQLNVQIGAKGPYDPRISGGRIYIRESGTDDEWNLLLDIDLTKGARISLTGDYTEWKIATNPDFYIGSAVDTYMVIDSISPITYEVINGYPSSIFSNDIGGVGENWKDAVVSNSRAFVCNVRIKDENKGQHKIPGIAGEADLSEFKDRIMYSMPNRYDTFPSFNFIEASKGDADHYMAIESYADRLLAFKRNSMDIINISSPSDANWFLEDTKNYMGVETHLAVAKTQYGAVWVNKNGLFLYDGQNIRDLTENKIDDTTWYTYVSNTSGIIYDEVKSSIFVIKSFSSDGDAYMCDLKKGNFTYLTDFTHDAITNPVDTTFSSAPNALVGTIENIDSAGLQTRFYKLHRSPQAQTNVELQTKNFTLGDPNIMKKIYAIYITYQASSSLAADVFYSTDGGDSWETDISGPSATSSTVWQKGKWTITDPPTASTIMVKIDTDATSNLVKINDIGIEYRPIHKRMA